MIARRVIAAASICCAMVACGGDSTELGPLPVRLEGTFELRSVNGRSVVADPHSPCGPADGPILGGNLRFFAGGLVERTIRFGAGAEYGGFNLFVDTATVTMLGDRGAVLSHTYATDTATVSANGVTVATTFFCDQTITAALLYTK